MKWGRRWGLINTRFLSGDSATDLEPMVTKQEYTKHYWFLHFKTENLCYVNFLIESAILKNLNVIIHCKQTVRAVYSPK